MTIRIILKASLGRSPEYIRNHLLRRYQLDHTSLLELAFEHWHLLMEDDREVLRAALEVALRNLLHRRNLQYLEFVELVTNLTAVLENTYEANEPVINPIIQSCYPHNTPRLRLKRHIGRGDAVVEVEGIGAI